MARFCGRSACSLPGGPHVRHWQRLGISGICRPARHPITIIALKGMVFSLFVSGHLSRSNMEATNTSEAAFRNWFDGYLNTIITTAALGGQITFAVIVTDIIDPASLQGHDTTAKPPKGFSKETVRLLIALSWFFFAAALGLAITSKLVYCSPLLVGAADLKLRPSPFIHAILTLVLNVLSVGAFFLLSLAITAYVPAVGWMGVTLLSLYFVAVLWLWLVMNTGFRTSAIAPMTGPFRPALPVSQGAEVVSPMREGNSAHQAAR
jgi:hypothetical protein